MSECKDNIVFQKLANKVINVIIQEISKEELQITIKDKMISPMLRVVFKEIHQYVYGLFILISLTLLFSLLSFVILMVMYFTFPKKLSSRI
jgi:hypothetical protein